MLLHTTVLMILEGSGKRCTKCGEWKGLEGFAKAKLGALGRAATCRDCFRQYRRENHEAILAQKKEYRETNRSLIVEKNSQFYQSNRETILAKQKKSYEAKVAPRRNALKELFEDERLSRSKTCRMCGNRKGFEEYSPDRRGKHGFSSYCRSCNSGRAKEYAALNPDKVSETRARYRTLHLDKLKASFARWYAKNGDRVKERTLARYWADPGKARQLSLAAAKANPQRVREAMRRFARKQVSECTDRYITSLVCKTLDIPASEVTPELVALKREFLTTKRLVRKITSTVEGKDHE